MRGSVVQEWLSDLSWKQQTVLLASFRGCDGVPKNDQSKTFTRLMRATLLKNADARSTFYGPLVSLTDETRAAIDDFFIDCSRGSLDQYPVHWLMHLLQAAEIVGYKCPIQEAKNYWSCFYTTGVKALHLNPETEMQCDARLSDA